jgi:hypothetical protein
MALLGNKSMYQLCLCVTDAVVNMICSGGWDGHES